MIVVPAIDIRKGRVVRLMQGRAEHETVYGNAPADVARRWEPEGAERLHVVDLDAAIDGAAADGGGRRGDPRRCASRSRWAAESGRSRTRRATSTSAPSA